MICWQVLVDTELRLVFDRLGRAVEPVYVLEENRAYLPERHSVRISVIEQSRKPSQRSVFKLLGDGSFLQVGPLLPELKAESGDAAGRALTDPLVAAVTEAAESLWRELDKEADSLVKEAGQQFERELKVKQAAHVHSETTAASPFIAP